MIRKGGAGSPRRKEKSFQKEDEANHFKHYREVK